MAAGPGLVARRTSSALSNAADVRMLARAGRPQSRALAELLAFLSAKSQSWRA
jgi:hypothetical protein